VGPRARLVVEGKRKITVPAGNQTRSSSPESVTSLTEVSREKKSEYNWLINHVVYSP
jgi:hypothetical protein